MEKARQTRKRGPMSREEEQKTQDDHKAAMKALKAKRKKIRDEKAELAKVPIADENIEEQQNNVNGDKGNSSVGGDNSSDDEDTAEQQNNGDDYEEEEMIEEHLEEEQNPVQIIVPQREVERHRVFCHICPSVRSSNIFRLFPNITYFRLSFQGFFQKSHLNRHITGVHGTAQFPCSTCGRRYKSKGSLRNHRVRDHMSPKKGQ